MALISLFGTVARRLATFSEACNQRTRTHFAHLGELGLQLVAFEEQRIQFRRSGMQSSDSIIRCQIGGRNSHAIRDHELAHSTVVHPISFARLLSSASGSTIGLILPKI
jgi:hypothetical protein